MKSEDQVWYDIARTFNIGNFENIKIGIGESRSINGEDSDKVYKALRKDVNNRMSDIIEKMKKDTDVQE